MRTQRLGKGRVKSVPEIIGAEEHDFYEREKKKLVFLHRYKKRGEKAPGAVNNGLCEGAKAINLYTNLLILFFN